MRRQDYSDPQSEIEVLSRRIDLLESAVRRLVAAGATSIQLVDTDTYIEPQQGELAVHHPKLATIGYYHEDRWHKEGRHVIKVFADDEVTLTGDGIFIFPAPVDHENAILEWMAAFVTSTGGDTTVQLSNIEKAHDFLSTPITIPAGQKYASTERGNGVINVANNLVNEADFISVDIIAGGGTLGFGVILAFS